jgi:hypothetical protein
MRSPLRHGSFSSVLLSLSTGHMIALGAIAIGFALLAFIAAMIVPHFKPDFPGKGGLKLFILASMVATAATLLAVEFFAVEAKEPAHGENTPTETTTK